MDVKIAQLTQHDSVLEQRLEKMSDNITSLKIDSSVSAANAKHLRESMHELKSQTDENAQKLNYIEKKFDAFETSIEKQITMLTFMMDSNNKLLKAIIKLVIAIGGGVGSKMGWDFLKDVLI